MRWSEWSLWSILVAVVLSVVGCSQDSEGRLSISGSVTFRGEPLANGTIEFAAVDATQLTGSTIIGGRYSIPAAKGLPPGKYIVRISATQDSPLDATEPPGPESMTQVATNLIPPEYNVDSSLTAEVSEGGRNEFQFDIP